LARPWIGKDRQDDQSERQEMKRYEVHWARLDPVEGSEIGKARPCVVVSRDALNAALAGK